MDSLVDQGIELPLMEAFYTLQGEGYHKGGAAYFIRIGGCDVGCHWCDVKESWNPKLHPATAIDQIISNAKDHSDTVVVTGGEPLMWDWFCLSPKKNKLPLEAAYLRADELKVIIHNKDDFRFAEVHAKLVGEECKLYLQPEWSNRDKMIPLMVDYVMKYPKWKISLQTHKYLNIP